MMITNELEKYFDPYEWEKYYFGDITREESEQILKNCPIGTFLIRISTTKNGYSLSVKELLTGPKQVKHYLLEVVDVDKIPRILMNGRVYTEMSLLIDYYKNNKLEHVSLKAPAPKAPLKKVIGLHRFEAEKPNDLSFERDETLDIIRIPEEGWWVARNALGMLGLIPSNYVREIDKSADSSENSPSRISANSWIKFDPGDVVVPAVVKAVSNRIPGAYDENGLKLKKGELIAVREVSTTGVCLGTIFKGGTFTQTGTFPITYVKWTNIPIPEGFQINGTLETPENKQINLP